jgi:hypothetical protein
MPPVVATCVVVGVGRIASGFSDLGSNKARLDGFGRRSLIGKDE